MNHRYYFLIILILILFGYLVTPANSIFPYTTCILNSSGFICDNNIISYGNITALNVHLPTYAFYRTNETIALTTTDVWRNVSYTRSIGSTHEKLTHNTDTAENVSFTIEDSGTYEISYDSQFRDSAANPTSIVGQRLIRNNVHVPGSYVEKTPVKQDKELILSKRVIVELDAGDVISHQVISSENTVEMYSYGHFAEYNTTASIAINRMP